MTGPERTRQQLDPLGTSGMGTVAVVVALLLFIYCSIVTLVSEAGVRYPILALAALLVLAVGLVVAIVGVSPYRAPFRQGRHLVAVAITFVAAVLSEASTWGAVVPGWQNWGAVAVGGLLLVLASYRPAKELAASGSIAALFLGLLLLVEAQSYPDGLPPIVATMSQITPVLALALAGAANSLAATREVVRWQRQVAETNLDIVEQHRQAISTSVRRDRITTLDQEVIPFLSAVLETGRITDDDRVRAGEIARAIRAIMVAEVDRSWLEVMIETAGGDGPGRSGAAAAVILDPDRLAAHMFVEQRTAMRAVISALQEQQGFTRDDLDISIARDGDLCRAEVIARLESGMASRTMFTPYLALLRNAFDEVEMDFDPPTLRIRFSYEQH